VFEAALLILGLVALVVAFLPWSLPLAALGFLIWKTS
jgi:hypothetical protein